MFVFPLPSPIHLYTPLPEVSSPTPELPTNSQTHSYNEALTNQPTHPLLTTSLIRYSAVPLFLLGNTLVLTSMYALGVTGTYLGDYFGILMDAPVTTFPFSFTDAPMYHGSTLSFLATAIWKGRPAGVLLTLFVAVAYKIARTYEDPFTGMIYAKREEERKGRKKAL